MTFSGVGAKWVQNEASRSPLSRRGAKTTKEQKLTKQMIRLPIPQSRKAIFSIFRTTSFSISWNISILKTCWRWVCKFAFSFSNIISLDDLYTEQLPVWKNWKFDWNFGEIVLPPTRNENVFHTDLRNVANAISFPPGAANGWTECVVIELYGEQ